MSEVCSAHRYMPLADDRTMRWARLNVGDGSCRIAAYCPVCYWIGWVFDDELSR